MANNNQYTMLDSFEIIGTWFLPHQKKEDGVKGTLKYSPHSIKLELNGIFEDESPFDQKNGILILGYTNTGEGVSLHNCSTIGISLGGYFTKSYIAELFFMGDYYIRDLKDNIFKKCIFSTTYLDAWLDFQVIERKKFKNTYNYKIDFDEIEKKKKKISIKKEKLMIKENFKMKENNQHDFYVNELHSISFNRLYELNSWYGKKQNYNYLINQVHKMRQLISLLIGIPVHYTYIDFILPDRIRKNNEYEHKVSLKCRLFFNQTGDITLKNFYFEKNKITLPKNLINESIERIMNLWFEKYDLFEDILNLYIGDKRLPTYEEIVFLNVVRCLESYHKKCRDVARKTLKDRLTSIFEEVPKELKEELYGNNFEQLKNKKISSIVKTRNHYTHLGYEENYSGHIIRDYEISQENQKLDVILQYLILKDIGINPSLLTKCLIQKYKLIKIRD